MKKLILAGLIATVSALIALPSYAQPDNDAVLQEVNTDGIIDILNNVTADTAPEQLRKELVAALNQACTNKNNILNNDSEDKLDNNSPENNEGGNWLKGSFANDVCCNTADIDILVNTVVNELGADNLLISDFLSSLSSTCSNSDAITLAAITAGVDATIASEATAAGPSTGQLAPPPVVSLPTLPTPPGSGGTGGDNGISEVGN
ncbi:hypothetical protein [Pseudoalteromonas arctica]|uniref:Secreted protein n=1 Tax=Pseudoalteromonas arctica TaxID=394751 RepID=A0A7Y0HB68_9GAMM|nr:hypothetical protein [Pseudoalteromonas arctica]NMM39547.1 hypothetical protein [Pseudoalteromonas arctica]